MNQVLECSPDRAKVFPLVGPDGDRFRFVFDAVNDGIFITDKTTGRLIDVNESGNRMFGYDEGELIGRGICRPRPH
jgi:PAS domain S-box-containing protein